MVKLNKTLKPTRQPRSADEVMEEVSERVPHILPHCFMDRDWIWVCNVDLRGEVNKPTRETLKEIGFRFSPGGHLMPDGTTRGTWGHSCSKPAFPKRRPATAKYSRMEDDPAALLRSLGL